MSYIKLSACNLTWPFRCRFTNTVWTVPKRVITYSSISSTGSECVRSARWKNLTSCMFCFCTVLFSSHVSQLSYDSHWEDLLFRCSTCQLSNFLFLRSATLGILSWILYYIPLKRTFQYMFILGRIWRRIYYQCRIFHRLSHKRKVLFSQEGYNTDDALALLAGTSRMTWR